MIDAERHEKVAQLLWDRQVFPLDVARRLAPVVTLCVDEAERGSDVLPTQRDH